MNDAAGGRYSGERALVVGSSGGIGRAFVSELVDHGADLAVTCHRHRATADAQAARAASLGRRALALALDLRDRAAIEAACRRILEEFGTPSIVVNCAGVLRDVPLVRMTPDDWDAVLETNLDGPFFLLRHLAPAMARAGRGRIVNVASVAALHGTAGQVNYAASKGALVALTRAMARELGGFNVTVNAIAPGFVETDMIAGLSDARRRRLLERIPARRFAAPEDVARAARVLMEADGSYVNGHVLVVDGGLTA